MTQQNQNPQPDEQRGCGSKNNRPREYAIECRFRIGARSDWSDWHTHRKYRTATERDAALANLSRKHTAFFEYRIQEVVK